MARDAESGAPSAATSLEFFSQISQTEWPQIPNPWAAGIAALLYQLEQTQWWPEADLAERQWRQTKAILQHAWATTPLYREIYGRAGLAPDDIRSRKDWQRLPVVDRSMLQAAGAAWRSDSPPQDHGALLQHFTSGSSGRPLHSISTTLTHLFKTALVLRQHQWAGRKLGCKAAFIEEVDGGAAAGIRHSGTWEKATEHVVRTGPALAISLRLDTATQLEQLRAFEPSYLIAYPSVIEALARHCLSHRISLPFLQQVGCFGEVLDPACRTLARQAWNVRIVDMYSAKEAGPIALQCPVHDCYHEQPEAMLVEILDADGRECRPGETGRVVLTSLHNFAAPLIRYEIGDLATRGRTCACGRTLPVIERILGRQRNMLRYPDGSARWPSLSETGFAAVFAQAGDMPPVQQFQLVQHSLARIEARLVTARPYTAAEEALLADYLHGEFGPHWQIDFSYPDAIARGPTGKFEDFLSHVAPEAMPPDAGPQEGDAA
ncbi:AMP-binding protein [Ferrovibrio sp.]|uniref:phenylacetate--CoA ligase family protein n=1 Tax=Ferrovibrio sp. TaxID=1917215 RepID=UPI00311FFF7D